MRILLTSSLLFWLSMLSAQPDTLDLDQVVVQSNRIELKFSEVSRSMEIITKEEIAVAPVQSVAELLHYVSGVDIRQQGINGMQADVSIRGGTFEQALILLNGIKLSDPQTGHHNLSLPIDIESIERIEVLKGPGARIYGQNAFAGAINIISKVPDERYSAIQLNAGENALGGIRVSAALPNSNFKQFLSFSKHFSEGYRHNTDYGMHTLWYQNQFKFINNEVNLFAGMAERSFGANGFYASPQFEDQHETVQTSLVALEFKHVTRNLISKPRFYWRRNQDKYILFKDNPSIYQNLHISQTYGFEWNNSLSSKLGTTGIGLDLNRVRLQSNNLGWYHRNVAGIFLEHRFEYGNLDITPGAAYYYYSDFGSRFFPGIDLGYRISPAVQAFANIGYTWRIPSFTDLYYQGPTNLGNPDLTPESALSYEAGLKYNQKGMHAQVSGFYRDGNNLIDWAKQTAADTLWQPLNYNNINTYGFDLSLGINLPRLLEHNFFIKNIKLAYTFLESEQVELDVVASRYTFDQLRHQFIFGFDYHIIAGLNHSIRYRYADRVSEAVGDYHLVDSRLSWKTKIATLYIEATNLFDQEYSESSLVPMPGRWIRGGVNFKFKY